MRNPTISLLVILSVAMTLPGPVAKRVESSLADLPIAITSVTADEMELRLSVVEEDLFDLVKLTPGKKFVSGAEPQVVVRGWSCDGKGASFECSGPETQQAHFSFRGDYAFDRSKKLGLELSYGGRSLLKRDLSCLDIERIEVIRGPQGTLSTPPAVRPGDLFVASPSTYIEGGKWNFQVGGRAIEPIDSTTLGDPFKGRTFPDNRLLFQMPEDVGVDTELRFTFDGPFGDRWADILAPDYFRGEVDDCAADLSSRQELTVVGDQVCACGCFPGTTGLNLTLDGNPIPFPSAASSRMIRIPLPDGTGPGTHTIGFPETGQSLKFEVVKARGVIDQSKLKVGQSTMLTFGLDGTEKVMPMEIGLTEGAVRISGGNRQVAWTSGGAENSFFRMLNAEGIGKFAIDYQFMALPCPCAGEAQDSLVDNSLATHPLTAEGSLNSRFLSGAKGEFPLTFSSNSIVTRTPFPPLPAEGVEIEFVQLGLRGMTPKFGEFIFEERVDLRSFGRFRDLRLGEEGGFRAADVDLELYTEFSTELSKKLPFKVGGTYELGLSDFELRGELRDFGQLKFQARPEYNSTLRFENIRKDAAGKNLYGEATFRLGVSAQLDF